MNAEQFAYWLQGALELGQVTKFNETQVRIIQDHLDLVFNKVTPTRKEETPSLVDRIRFPNTWISTPPPVVKGPTLVPQTPDLSNLQPTC